MKKNIAVSDGARSDGEPYSVGDGPENSVASPSDEKEYKGGNMKKIKNK